jgi:hypothetical protein
VRYLDRFLRMRCSGDVLNIVGWNPKRMIAALAVRQAAKQIVMERRRKGMPCTVYAYDDPLLAVVMAFTLPAPVVLITEKGDVPFKMDGVRNISVIGTDCVMGDFGEHPEGVLVSSRPTVAADAVNFANAFRIIDGLAILVRREHGLVIDPLSYLMGSLEERYPYAAVRAKRDEGFPYWMYVLTMDNGGEVV